ncbi:T9SS type A sorting domain-containing protein [Winogradskyella flava]|uniref:T9SS type A sorting domain-containing protein n=1 Tax=Winogradskyella flava TaxID=1884876 RepID=UPI0024905C29|nr:T9SS type A sorting domain-containing protein [Winogradskyella flava]
MKKITFFLIFLPFLNFGQIQIGQDIDGEMINDQSGEIIGISSDGLVLAIGSVNNDGNGIDSGHVRIYEFNGTNWIQKGNDIDGAAAGDLFGGAVSISSDGNTIAIGATNNDDNGTDSGHVRVFEFNGTNWVQKGIDLVATDNEPDGDRFGKTVSLSDDGNTLAVSSVDNDFGTGIIFFDFVRIYEYINNSWVQKGSDIFSNEIGSSFGWSLSLSSNGNIVAIGDQLKDANGNDSGDVQIYEFNGTNWIQKGSSLIGLSSFDRSGYSLSLSGDGNIVAIGAPASGENGSLSGHVIIYEFNIDNWIQKGMILYGENLGYQFGRSLSLSEDGSLLAIGAIGYSNSTEANNTTGGVYIYKFNLDSWVQIANVIEGEALYDAFGVSVSISDERNIVAIGALNNDGNGTDSGHVRVYSIASELALLEVVEDIAGNSNGINVSAEQLNAIEGVSGAIDGVNYTTALQNGTYSDSSSPTAIEIQFVINQVNASLSLVDYNSLKFSIYPNPTRDQFIIHLDNLSDLQNVTVYNNLGQLVLTSKEGIINTSKLSSGLYAVKVETTKGKGSKNLIIE